MRKQTLHAFYGLLLGLLVVGLLALFPHPASASNPTTINFQGKVVNSDGTNVTNGTYSFIFRIYNTASPTMTTSCTSTATCLWQETQGSVSVTNGVFQVELGSACALTSSSCNNSAGGPINFSSTSSLYLTLQFNGDTSGSNGGYMSPTIHLTSVPFAFQADNSSTLGGLAAGNFVQLAQGLQADSSTTNASIAINKTGSTANILTLQKSGVSVMTIDNGGLLTVQPAASITASSSGITQTLTNASTTATTVNGYSQNITVSNSTTASTTSGFNISLTDSTGLINTDRGISVSLTTTTAQDSVGVNSLVSNGIGLRGTSQGGSPASCGGTSSSFSIGVCGDSTGTNGTGVYARSSGAGNSSTPIATASGAGVFSTNNATGAAGKAYYGVSGNTQQSGAAAYTSVGVFGNAQAGSGATAYSGYFTLQGSSATLGAALYASNNTVAANILDLQDNTTSVFTVADNGLITLQPAAALTGTGTQSNVSQTLTNNQTGGTVNGYNQSITVSNASGASSTNGFNISISDTSSSLANADTALSILINGANTSKLALGVDVSVNSGVGIRSVRSGTGAGGIQCGNDTIALGVCGDDTDNTHTGAGILGTTNIDPGTSLSSVSGAGVIGKSRATGTAGSNYVGVKGIASQTAAAAYTSVGVYGNGNGGAGASIYGGYFALGTGGATAGAALYATNSTVAANILDLQDNTTSVFTVGDGGLITLQPAASLTSGQAEVTQTFTNGSSTGGTVVGYSQNITVSNTLVDGSTKGFDITITDNTARTNTNRGIAITLNGTSANQGQYGVDVSVNHGAGIRAVSSGASAVNCIAINQNPWSVGVCGNSSASSSGTGVVGTTSSQNSSNLNIGSAGGEGVLGENNANTTVNNFVAGIRGVTNGTGTAGTSIAVLGQAKAGAGATTYGGYFALDSGSSATLGAALYATNSTVAANILDLQDNTTSVFTVGDGGLVTASTNSATGFVVKDSSSSKEVFTIDTSGDQIVLGKAGASGLDGKLTFKNATGSGTASITLTGNPSTSYTYQLPTGTVSSNSCLQSGTVSGTNVPLTFASCGAGGGTFATDYSTTSQASNTVTYSNSGGGALILQNASTPLTTLFTIENNAATFNYLTVTLASSIPHLQIYGASSTSYADIYYDAGTSTAHFSASSGTTQIGTGSGAVNITAGAASAVAITGHANSTFTTDSGYVRLDGPSGVQLGVPSSSSGNLVFNYGSGAATAAITFAGNATANYVYTLPSTAVSSSQCLQSGTVSGTAVPLTFGACGSGSGTAISVNGSAVGSTANIVDTAATGASTGVTYTFGSGNITTVIGNASTSAAGAVTTGSQSFAGDKIFQSTTNSSTAFQIQDSVGASMFLVDTTSTDAAGAQVNYITYSGFEVGNPPTGWTATNPTGGTTTLTQNSNKQHTFNGLFSASVAISANTSGGGGMHTGTFASAPPGSTSYYVSFYAKISSGTIASNLFTVTTTGGAGSCSPASGITINANGFQRLSCLLSAGTGTITDFKISDSVTTLHTLFIDSVQMQKTTYNGVSITAPTAYQFGEIQLRGVITNPLIVANNGDSTSAFQIQKSSGSAVITADTLNGQVLLGNASSLTGLLTFNNSSGANTVGITSGNVSTSYTITLPTAVAAANNYCLVSTTGGVTSWTQCGASTTATVTLTPEFPGAVMTGDGTSNTGTMTSDFCSNTVGSLPALTTGCNSGQTHNFYQWTANATNDYEIFVKWAAPTDFSSFSSFAFNGFRTSSSDAVTVTVYNAAGTSCGSASIAGTVNTWNNATSVSTAGCSAPSPGDILTIDVHLSVGVNSEFARIGEMTITYNRK